MSDLGRLVRVENVRAFWPNEAHDFSRWLAGPENLVLLSEFLGLGPDGLELESVEHFVGPYRADILCRNTHDGTWVLVENQLEPTDHSHLGQIVTYAAGLDARTIVWISSRVTEQHRAAIEWLNSISSEQHSFFAAEIELWQIGNSPPAPRLNSVVRPNAELRAASVAKQTIAEGAVSATKDMQFRYWSGVQEVVRRRAHSLRPVSPQANSWISYGVGKTGVSLNMAMNTREHWARVEIYFTGRTAKAYFAEMQAQASAIESELGEPLDWQPLPDKQDARICLFLRDADPFDETDWPRQHAWLAETAERLHRVFAPRVRRLTFDASPLVS